MFNGRESAGVERSDKLNQIRLVLVLNLLLFHPQVVVVLEVSVDDHLVQVPDDSDLGIGLDIVLSPLLQVAFLDVDLPLVHYLHEQSVVFLVRLNLAVLRVLDQL